MLSFISAKEAAEKWNISQRRVSVLCGENRISGAMMVGNMWIIPSNAEKPQDKRVAADVCSQLSKKAFEITIEESVSKTFLVKADSEEEAERIATEKYKNGVFTLEPGNLVCKQMQICNKEDNTCTEWFEF